MSSEELKKIAYDAPKSLVDAIQKARKAGKRYKGEVISNRLIYEIGARVYLGIGDETEEVLRHKIEEIEVQENIMRSQKQLLTEELERFEAEKKVKEAEVLKNQQDIETLSLKIIEYWERITSFKQKEYIGFIINLFPEKLTKETVSAIFPNRPSDAPTNEEAFKIATELLNGGL